MNPDERDDIVLQVLSGALEPLAAADLFAGNGNAFGFGVDLKVADPEAAARLEVFMGRFLWLSLRRGGVDIPEPESIEDYRRLVAQTTREDDDVS